MRLFFLPHAGGSASYYSHWRSYFNDDITFIPVEYSGRGTRVKEPLNNNITEMRDDILCRYILPAMADGENYLIFGHSLGTVIAWEIASQIQLLSIKLPICIIFSGRLAPNVNTSKKILKDLPSKELIEEIYRMGGIDTDIIENNEILNYFLPIIRNDIKIVEEYQLNYSVYMNPLNTNFIVLYGEKDIQTANSINEWSKLTNMKCEYYQFDGNHFFINDYWLEIIGLINKKVNSCKLQ